MRAIIDIANFQIIDEPPAPNDPPSPQNEGTHHLEISGFIPDKLSTNVLRLYPGRCANDNGTKFAWSSTAIDIDLTVLGKNGLDAGDLTEDDYCIYIVKNETTSEVAAVASKAIIYGEVVVPAGFSIYRKLPYSYPYSAARGGLPNHHCSWQKPYISYTDAEDSMLWKPLNVAVSNGQWMDADLSEWIPDSARMIRLQCKVDAVGAAGTAYLRSYSGQSVGLEVGSAMPDGLPRLYETDIRVTSDRKIQYRTIGGARLTVVVLGYQQTEPS